MGKNKNKITLSPENREKLERVLDPTSKVETKSPIEEASIAAKSGNHAAAKEAAFKMLENGVAPAQKGYKAQNAKFQKARKNTDNNISIEAVKAAIKKAVDVAGLAELNTLLGKITQTRIHAVSGLEKAQAELKKVDTSKISDRFKDANGMPVSAKEAQAICDNSVRESRRLIKEKNDARKTIQGKIDKAITTTSTNLKAVMELMKKAQTASGTEREQLQAEAKKLISQVPTKEAAAAKREEREQKIVAIDKQVLEIELQIADLVDEFDVYMKGEPAFGKLQSHVRYASQNVKLHDEAIALLSARIAELHEMQQELRRIRSVQGTVNRALHNAKCGKAADATELDRLYAMYEQMVAPAVTEQASTQPEVVNEIATVAQESEIADGEAVMRFALANLAEHPEYTNLDVAKAAYLASLRQEEAAEVTEPEAEEADVEVMEKDEIIYSDDFVDKIIFAAAQLNLSLFDELVALENKRELIDVAALEHFTEIEDGYSVTRLEFEDRDTGTNKFRFHLVDADIAPIAQQLVALIGSTIH